MATDPEVSAFRVEKLRSRATITLSNGETLEGCFFLSPSGAHLPGPERVGDLLNGESGFFPFELQAGSPRTVLLNRTQILTVTVADDEARQVPGYDVAATYLVAIGLSQGLRVMGEVRVYAPGGHQRLSDWTRDPEPFRYVECDGVTLLVNLQHVIDVCEAPR